MLNHLRSTLKKIKRLFKGNDDLERRKLSKRNLGATEGTQRVCPKVDENPDLLSREVIEVDGSELKFQWNQPLRHKSDAFETTKTGLETTCGHPQTQLQGNHQSDHLFRTTEDATTISDDTSLNKDRKSDTPEDCHHAHSDHKQYDQSSEVPERSMSHATDDIQCEQARHESLSGSSTRLGSEEKITKEVKNMIGHPDVDFDRIIHPRSPIIHEEIQPHIHHVYQLHRTRSIHLHEHKTWIQPIKDPNPTVLPVQHWAQNDSTKEVFKIPYELGKSLTDTERLSY